MASSTAVTLHINGVDRTRGVFASLQTRLQVLGARVRLGAASLLRGIRLGAASLLRGIRLGAASLLRGIRNGVAALPGVLAGALSRIRTGLLAVTAGVVGLTAATVSAAKSFSQLSDRAAQAGTTADELDRLAATLSGAGVKNANIDTIADAFARMTKTTGAVGLAGFRETLATIAGMGDEADRVKELSRVFGRQFGPGLAATVRQGPEAFRQGLDGVMGALSTVSNKAVDAGDAIADGFDFAKRGVLRSIQTVLVDAASRAFGKIGVSARGAGIIVSEYAKVYGEIILRNLGPLWDRVSTTLRNFPELVRNILSTIGVYIKMKVGEWAEALMWISGALAAIAGTVGALPVAYGLVAATAGFAALRGAADGAQEELDKLAARRAELFGDARPFDFTISDEQRKRLDAAKEAAKSIDASMEQLVKGVADAGEEAEDTAAAAVRSSLGPIQSAAAIAANSYEAYKIGAAASANNSSPVDLAALNTAKNTAALVANSEKQTRLLEKTAEALSNHDNLFTLEG